MGSPAAKPTISFLVLVVVLGCSFLAGYDTATFKALINWPAAWLSAILDVAEELWK